MVEEPGLVITDPDTQDQGNADDGNDDEEEPGLSVTEPGDAQPASETPEVRVEPHDAEPDPNPSGQASRVFCVNAGNCGGRYLVNLLQENGLTGVVHEKEPMLALTGYDHYHGRVETSSAASMIRNTRGDIWFENNWGLTLLIPAIREAFPDARFIYLFRDGRDNVRTTLSAWNLTVDQAWASVNTHEAPDRQGDWVAPAFLRACKRWLVMNKYAIENLADATFLPIPFERLINAEPRTMNQLQDFLDTDLDTVETDPVGGFGDKSFPAYEGWTADQKNVFWWLCGRVMKKLGYDDNGYGHDILEGL